MRLTSIIVLALAVCLGIVGVLGVRTLLQNNRDAAMRAEAPAVAATTVVVARTPLEFGTELQADLLKEIQWASTEIPEGAFTKVNEVVAGERRVALRSIAPGELVLKDRVSGFGGRATLSQIIQPGMRAVTLRVNDVSGAGGFVLPGDRVDVLSTIQPTKNRIDTVTNILLQDVRVLAIDQMADENQEGAVVAKAATLEVDAEEAQKIALASTIGTLSLSLRNIASEIDPEAEAVATKAARTIGYSDLGPEVQARPVQKRRVVRARTAPAPQPSPFTTMRVVRGTESSSATVLKDKSEDVVDLTRENLRVGENDLLGGPGAKADPASTAP